MIRVELETTINSPVEEVFDRLTDLPGYNNWMSGSGLFRSSKKTSEGPTGKGTTFLDMIRSGHAEGEITEYDKPTHVQFRQTVYYRSIRLMESRPGYTLKSENGRTRLYHLAEGNLSGAFRILEPVVTLIARAERKRTVRNLKKSLEENRQG